MAGEAFGTPVDVAIDAGTFDFTAWVQGMQPVRRAVKIYARGDLLAEADRLEAEIQAAQAAAEAGVDEPSIGEQSPVSALEERLAEVLQRFSDSAIEVVLEGRSERWIADQEKALTKAKVTDKAERLIHLLAGHVVSPVGVTADALMALREKSEPQIRRLLTAMTLVDNQQPDVNVPFSRASSASHGGRQQ